MKKYYLLLLMCVPMGAIIGQNNTADTALITETIENYFYGYLERDSMKLLKAFDTENGTMKIPFAKNGTVMGYENAFFKDLVTKWSTADTLSEEVINDAQLSIQAIDVASGTIASAKLIMEVDDNTYIDILSLQKINGQWKITNKIYMTATQ